MDQPGLDEIQEHLLFMAVIIRMAGCDLARPVDRQPHQFQLAAHGVDIGVGPFGGMDFLFHRGVFRRHAEGIPTHRVQHIEAAGAFIARDHVAHCVVPNMPHVDPPRRIGKHFEHVIFRQFRVFFCGETADIFPSGLPARFCFLEGVSCGNPCL